MASMTATAPARGFTPFGVAKGILGGLLGITFGLALGAVVVAILATQFFGFKLVTISSASMEPELSIGELVVIRPASQEDVEDGDIIFFTGSGVDAIPTLHRVVGRNTVNTVLRNGDEETTTSTYHFITKGDANERPDTTEVTPDHLEGELWFTVPFITNNGGLSLQTALIGVATALGIGWVSYELYNRMGKKDAPDADAPGGGAA